MSVNSNTKAEVISFKKLDLLKRKIRHFLWHKKCSFHLTYMSTERYTFVSYFKIFIKHRKIHFFNIFKCIFTIINCKSICFFYLQKLQDSFSFSLPENYFAFFLLNAVTHYRFWAIRKYFRRRYGKNVYRVY